MRSCQAGPAAVCALLLAAAAAVARPPEDDGLPGSPRLPSAARGEVAPTTTSVAAFVGRWVLRGHAKLAQGEPRPMVVRLTVREAPGGGLTIERRWETTPPGRSQAVTITDVRVAAAGRLEARFRLGDRPTAGLAGALAGDAAPRAAADEVEWKLLVGAGGARELTKDRAGGTNVTGKRLLVRDLVPAPVRTLARGGPPRDRYDITFVSDGYAAEDMPVYRRHVDDAVARLRATSPFREYWGYLNVHRVEVVSPGRGLAGARGGPSALRTQVPANVPSKRRIPIGDEELIKRAAALAPGADAVVVLCFDPFRSVARDGYTLVSTWEDRFPRVTVHELGHVIGLLLDEYSDEDDEPSGWDFLSANAFVEGLKRWRGWGANVTTHTSPESVPWRRWLPAGVPVPTPAGAKHPVGVYEGAYHAQRRWHRPSPTCLMRETDEPFCVVCREQLVLKLSEKTNPVRVKTERLDQDTVRLTVTSSVPGAQRVVWLREHGAPVAAGTSLLVRRRDLSWGDTKLWLRVQDLTPWVRDDEDGRATYDFTFVLRKGLLWDRGLECVGPIPGRPSRGDPTGLTGGGPGWSPNGFPR